MKGLKRALCAVIAFAMCACVFTSCGKNETNTGGKVETGKTVDGTETVMTVDGKVITADEYRYFLAMTAMNTAYADKDFNGDTAAYDWSKIADEVTAKAKKDLISRALVVNLGEKNGIKPDENEWAQIESSMQEYKNQNGEDMFNATLLSMGVTTADGYKKAYELETLYTKIQDDFAQNASNYISDKSILKEYKSDDTVTAQHILILNESEKHAEPKNVIEDVLKRAKSGEDFNALMTEFNEDPGESAGGYTFGKGEMVAEFEEAAFALDYDEISDVVESSYGYHIIKRIVGIGELERYLEEQFDEIEESDIIKDITLEGVIKSMNEANAKLEASQGGEK